MMTNLFSIFDPSTSILKTSWFILPISMTMLQLTMWKNNPPMKKIQSMIISTFKKEVKFTLMKSEKGSQNMIMLVFTAILTMNFLALYPQVFSVTSHLTITLPLSLTFWMTIMMFNWTKNTSHALSHLLPQGTPVPLMMFMVMIELVSNMIRPITLCVRLTANLVAGHLLMSLLGNFLINSSVTFSILSSIMPTTLTILESAVACIQAYVFMTLITLYVTETK